MTECVGFTLLYETSAGLKEDMKDEREGVREDVVCRDANTSIKNDKTQMRPIKKIVRCICTQTHIPFFENNLQR